jgi:predicted amidohydrolase YtcJ
MIARRDFVLGGAVAAGLASLAAGPAAAAADGPIVETIITNAKIATFDAKTPRATALAIYKGRIAVVGDDAELLRYQAPTTRVIDAKGKTLIPGLTDAQLSLVRTGLVYTAELRWDGVPTVADALRMVKVQAARTPAGQWVRVVGGWSPYQFAEKRSPTLDEIEAASGNVPTMILLSERAASVNRAGFRALGVPPTTSGMLEGAATVGEALARLPRLGLADQETGTRLLMRELNRLGVTSCIDSGGAGVRYPEDYAAIAKLDRDRRITVRTAYSLAPSKPGEEVGSFLRFVGNTQPYTGDAFYRQNGGGPVLLYAADDGADLTAARPALGSGFASDLSSIVTLLAQNNWPFGVRAAYAESIDALLTVIERVNAKTPFNAPFWIVGAETIDDRAIARIAALKGGIVVTDRLAFQGEAYALRNGGASAVRPAATVAAMLAAGVTVGLGTDGTRNASYNPWLALYWLVAQRTVGGLRMGTAAPLKRDDALRLMTANGAWFSYDGDVKGTIAPGRLADLAILSDDYFTVPDARIPDITADVTIVGGAIVHAQSDFAALAPPAPTPSPAWSPIAVYGAAHPPVVRS